VVARNVWYEGVGLVYGEVAGVYVHKRGYTHIYIHTYSLIRIFVYIHTHIISYALLATTKYQLKVRQIS